MQDLLSRVSREFAGLSYPTPQQLATGWKNVAASLPELLDYAGEPGIYPYGRKRIFATEHIEVMVMNWAGGRTCAPHDHGASFGLINVVSGNVDHTLYTLNQHDIPVPYLTRVERCGSTYFAARSMVHAMGNPSSELTITAHLYAPPISRMKVYDLSRCAVCVVSDDCGAWWPDEQRQVLEVLRLGPGASRHEPIAVGQP